MSKFLKQLKQELVNQQKKDTRFDACGYYNTIIQYQDKIECVINDGSDYNVSIHYDKDKSSGYTQGKLTIYFYKYNADEEMDEYLDYHYEIGLLYDDRYWGYCECDPEDEGYNEQKHCCGSGCDWSAPRVEIIKVNNVADFSFGGYAKDMWELKDKWNNEFKSIEEDEKRKQVEYLEHRIKDLEEERSKLLN